MTTYDILKELEEQGILTDALRKEVISVTLAYHKKVYEDFLKERQHRAKSDAVLSAAVKNQMSERFVYYIIKKMEG